MNSLLTSAAVAVGLFAATPAMAQIVPYAGVNLGYGHATYTPNDVLPTDTGGQGWAPGIFAGLDYLMGPRLSLSGEFDWAWTNFKGGQRVGARIVEHTTKMPINLKLSVGYRFRQTTLSAGVGFGRASIETSDTLTNATVKEGATSISWLLGFRRDLSSRSFLRGEYMRSAYGDVAFITGNAAELDTLTETFQVGFGRKF